MLSESRNRPVSLPRRAWLGAGPGCCPPLSLRPRDESRSQSLPPVTWELRGLPCTGSQGVRAVGPPSPRPPPGASQAAPCVCWASGPRPRARSQWSVLWVGLPVDADQCSGLALKVTLGMSQRSRDRLAAGMRQMSCHGNEWSNIAPVPSHLDHRSRSACCWPSHTCCRLGRSLINLSELRTQDTVGPRPAPPLLQERSRGVGAETRQAAPHPLAGLTLCSPS